MTSKQVCPFIMKSHEKSNNIYEQQDRLKMANKIKKKFQGNLGCGVISNVLYTMRIYSFVKNVAE